MNNAATLTTVDTERFKQCIFLRVSIHRWGNRAKVTSAEALQAYLVQRKAESEDQASAPEGTATLTGAGVTATKRLLKSKALDELNEHLTNAKANVLRVCNPSNIMPGLVVTSAEQYAKLDEALQSAVADMQMKFLPAFQDDFAPAIERAQVDKIKDGGLGPLFNAADYPTADKAAEAFGLEWFPVSLKVPDNIPAELRAEAAAKLDKTMNDAAEQVTLALRQGMAELIQHAQEKLAPSDDGKKKIFRDSLIGNIQEFIDCFAARNIMNDEALAALVDKAKTVLTGIQGKPGQKAADVLRTNEAARQQTAAQFAEIAAQLDGMITEQQSRSFSFDQD